MLSGAPSSQACPVGCPFKQVPAFVVPIRTIAAQRNTAKTLPQSSLASPALWPVHWHPCRALPPIEATRTSQSLPSPSGQSPPKGTPRKLCHKAASHPPALWPVHRRPCRAARFPGAPDGRKLKRCHALGSVFFPGAPGWMPFQASSSLCCPHSDNRRPKEHHKTLPQGSLAFPALWPVRRRPCRALPPIEAARTSQSLPLPSWQSPPMERVENCRKALSAVFVYTRFLAGPYKSSRRIFEFSRA